MDFSRLIDNPQFTMENVVCNINPTNLFVKQRKNERSDDYYNYMVEFRPGFFEDFVEFGLFPFIKKHGYRIGVSEEICTKRLKHWAWAHMYVQTNKSKNYEITKELPYHDGGIEEYDWFNYNFPDDTMAKFYKRWGTVWFLDSSECGLSQQNDFKDFIWIQLDLYNSKNHIFWKDNFSQPESDDENSKHNDYMNSTHEYRRNKGDLY